jgi:hypothetical protein
MKALVRVFATIHSALALLFAIICVLLLVTAVRACWDAFTSGLDVEGALALIEAMGITAVAVVALQISQTIVEEEVIREANVSAPTRVRRFLSRFIVVMVIALAIEGLVATMKALHQDPTDLPYAASIIASVAALLAGWGAFVWFNRAAEDVEPEAMQKAKQEDDKVD